MKREHIANEIKGIVVLAAALILFASLLSFVPEDLPWYTSSPNVPVKNLIRLTGAYTAGAIFFVIGTSAYAIVVFLFFFGWDKLASKELKFSFSKLISFAVIFCVISSLFSMIGSQNPTLRFQRSGMLGLIVSDFLVNYFGWTGAYIILVTLGLLTLVLIGEFLVSPILFGISDRLKEWFVAIKEGVPQQKEKVFSLKKPPFQIKDHTKEKIAQKPPEKPAKKFEFKLPIKSLSSKNEIVLTPKAEFRPLVKPQIKVATPVKKEESVVINSEPQMVGEYHLPTLDLLSDSPALSSGKIEDDLVAGAKTLEATLAEFGVTVRVADIERGPVITRYELEPAPGVKVQQITTLSDDIALAMKAQTVRIVAPIPGKNRVGVEVPNSSSSLVFLKDVLTRSEFRSGGSKLNLALGKDIAGESMIADLGGMPHLLIAGTTGSGKTVCLNSIIMSMLFNASPDELKFLIIDPKMVELAMYSSIPHALCPAITDAKKASAALNWVVGEMENRYSVLAQEGVRNIEGYLAKGRKMSYIVVVVDELADLMQVAAKQIESAITRLAQLSRAVGIHLILATQRPSVDVITGVIKANFPARISFKVASKVDSRTVLDMNGADKLLGKGDMLFMKPGDAKPTRGQCCFISDQEIQKVVDFIKSQQQPVYNENIIKQQTAGAAGTFSGRDDELYEEAVRVVMETSQASVTILQRRLRLGYSRAARLIDMMEQNGLVGPFVGSKPRDILINREEWLMKNSSNAPQEG